MMVISTLVGQSDSLSRFLTYPFTIQLRVSSELFAPKFKSVGRA